MATYTPGKPPKPITFDDFKGLNEGAGELNLEIGEASKQLNVRLTKNRVLKQRKGFVNIVDYGNTKPVFLWGGEIDNKQVIISTNDGNVYEYSIMNETNTLLGTLSNTNEVTFFFFVDKLYFLNGADYKEYDGTTFQDVIPYIPVISIEGNPDGSNYVSFEELNVLTGSKIQKFVGNGVDTVYKLVEQDIDSIDKVIVNGVETTAYTPGVILGELTFDTAPEDSHTVDITFTKNSTANPEYITSCRYAMDFGPGNDTTIFLWGNINFPNRRINSRYLNAAYFPSNGFTDVGSVQSPITDIIAVYQNQIIFTENKTFYSYPQKITYADGGTGYVYPQQDLNEQIGGLLYGQVRLVDNMPVSFSYDGIHVWTNTRIEDENNEQNISFKVKDTVSKLNTVSLKTVDYTKQRELWFCDGTTTLVWNYENKAFYTYDNIHAVDFATQRGELYFGTNGTIEYFNEISITDNGEAVNAVFETGFTGFGVPYLRKNTRTVYVTIDPDGKVGFEFSWETNKKVSDSDLYSKSYATFSYSDINYSDWSYAMNMNPQPIKIRIRAKKYSYIKFKFKNSETDRVLSITDFKVSAVTTGEVR